MKKEDINKLIKNLELRNIDATFFETFDEAKTYLLDLIPTSSTVGIGHSCTLEKIGISAALVQRGNTVYDKTLAVSREESRELKKKALISDWFVTGSNAISIDGHIVNVDHSGNRVAAMIYGPEHVVVIVGVNKVVGTLEDAIYRVKNVASPQNAKRAGFNPPCVKLGSCVDCKSTERVCNSLVIIEGQDRSDRMKVVIVNEEAGF